MERVECFSSGRCSAESHEQLGIYKSLHCFERRSVSIASGDCKQTANCETNFVDFVDSVVCLLRERLPSASIATLSGLPIPALQEHLATVCQIEVHIALFRSTGLQNDQYIFSRKFHLAKESLRWYLDSFSPLLAEEK